MRNRLSPPDHGAFVISLDFELMWGLRDRLPRDGGSYRANILGVWQAIPAMLQLFAEHNVSATWATVGFLFAEDRHDLLGYLPSVRPAYDHASLNPYLDLAIASGLDPLLYFAPSLIKQINGTPGQELASHTFSHYYCLESGQTAESFRHDLECAQAIAAPLGVHLRSIVLPRNQINLSYAHELRNAGFTCYRGNQRGAMHQAGTDEASSRLDRRVARFGDAYFPLSGRGSVRWDDIRQETNLCNLPASQFLRPWSPQTHALDRLRLHRIVSSLRSAAKEQRLFHLWWHPHNFGCHLQENMSFLRQILDEFAVCRQLYGMQSLTMSQAVELAIG